MDGGTDFSNVQPNDLVAVRMNNAGRTILFPAGSSLSQDRVPLEQLGDGVHTRLDGAHIVKLGGEAMVLDKSHPES